MGRLKRGRHEMVTSQQSWGDGTGRVIRGGRSRGRNAEGGWGLRATVTVVRFSSHGQQGGRRNTAIRQEAWPGFGLCLAKRASG